MRSWVYSWYYLVREGLNEEMAFRLRLRYDWQENKMSWREGGGEVAAFQAQRTAKIWRQEMSWYVPGSRRRPMWEEQREYWGEWQKTRSANLSSLGFSCIFIHYCWHRSLRIKIWVGFDQCLAINLLYDSGKLRSFLLASERPQLWNKEIELRSRWSMNSLWVLTFYDSNLCPERWSWTLPFLQSTERPLCEPEKQSSGSAGHLPWIVKLPRLKIGWEAEDCISPALLPFLTGRVCREIVYFAPVFITFPVSSECLMKVPQFSSIIKGSVRNEWRWKA